MHSVSNLLEPIWAMVDGIHGRDVGQEGLGGADVAGSLVSANVLLSGLEAQPIRGVLVHIPEIT